MADPIVILGSGLAGYAVAREFRKLDRDAPLVMVSRDAGDFYAKPMLSNALAQGKTPAALVTTPGERMAEQLGLTLIKRTEVHALDTAVRSLRTADGDIAYSKLVLALGADPIRLPLSGDAAGEVLSVNDLDDYAGLRAAIEGKRRVALLGAGLIGCEFANDLAGAGYEVEVLDPAPWPLGRLLPEASGDALREGLAAAGVRWRLGVTAQRVDRAGNSLQLTLSDGSALDTDVVVSAVGLAPRTGLAQAAGIAVRRGIVANRCLATSAADVYALGDCAEVEGLWLPYVMPIMNAARALAKTLAGSPTPVSYPAMPVVVKTPALPTVVAPPRLGAAGRWRIAPGEG
ncbi:MAG TPA: FAD-dependent oxidoreductase, partial [Burkholderiales bacterium]|nr:FAD-dependent oxidoreductase [Burkholderiales bacterium]